MKTVVYFYESAFMMWRLRLAGIYAVARQERWHVEFVDVGDLPRGVKPVLAYWKPDGVIVEGGVFRHRGCSVAAFDGLTAVFCDADAAQVGAQAFAVRHNSEEVVKKALSELFARDFADYGYVHYNRARRDWSMEREAIFRREMKRRAKRGHVFRVWEGRRAETFAGFAARLEAFVANLPKPCGVLAANDEMAVHVLRAAERAGVAVPEEMAVMGIDNDVLVCENTLPTLSSVAPAFERSGRLAAGLLARRFKNPKLKPVELTFGSSPIERRHSTRPTERVDLRAVRAVEYVRVHACKGLTAADVVREMGMRTRTAENRFRAVAGHSIRDEIVAVRVAQAQKLLADPKVAVDSVFSRCGYRDPRSLRYAFTAATGLSPRAWREKTLQEGSCRCCQGEGWAILDSDQ